jgi:molecular chaperone HtpG
MVAERVEVVSKKAGEEQAFKWISDGKGNFDIEEGVRSQNGTTVTLYLTESGEEFANHFTIEAIIKKYSNHISFPIFLNYYEEKTEGAKTVKEKKERQVNAASAMWKRPKSELKKEDYNDFYRSITHDTEEPLHSIHTQAEGKIEYTTLFFIPKKAPIDLYWADFQPGVKLYIKRVFITDDEKELLPRYLRFIRGIIDSEDLPLNISREMLQKNSILTKIRNDSVKKILSEIKNLKKDKEQYNSFYEEFGKPLKEGVYQDFNNQETLLELLQFKSTKSDGYTSFSEYKDRMKEDQKAIYYITGENEKTLRSSPLLEAWNRKDIEVLIMDDDIDEIVIPAVGKYKEIELKSLNRSDALDDMKSQDDKEQEKKLAPLVKRIKKILEDEVKDVRASTRLSDSPSCIVADEKDPTIQLQHILKSMGQLEVPEVKPILEINPGHKIVKKLEKTEDKTLFEDIARLLFEQALLMEGVQPKDTPAFVQRLNRTLERSF